MFNIKRFQLARKKRSLTKKAISEKLNISVQTLSEWETGKVIPKYENILELSKLLNFPVDFFENTFDIDLIQQNVSFRALTKMKASERDLALACGECAIYFNNWLEDKFELPQWDINIKIENSLSPVEVAKELKKQYDMGDYIDNTIHFVEKHGVRVYSMVEDVKNFDAFSTWYNDTPFIFINTLKSSERSRFDIMHELGHLILHHGISLNDRQRENEANQFASEMLMPEDSIRLYYDGDSSIENLIEFKKQWKVSLKAFVYRLKTLDLISEWVYRNLMIEISEHGYDKKEPETIDRETSLLLNKALKILKEDGFDLYKISNDLKLPVLEINRMTFNYMNAISGLGNNTEKRKEKPKLRLIE